MKEKPAVESGFKVSIDRSHDVYSCSQGDTLLRAGLRAGIGLSYECNVGACGSCKIILIEGAIRDLWPEAPGLSDRDRERRMKLACQSSPMTDCKIRAAIGEQYRPRYLPHRCGAQLRAVNHVTHDMREFCFVSDGAANFLPGQYALFTVQLSDGREVTRAYSMSNVKNPEGQWNFIIRKVPGGEMTSYLFDSLSVGDEIELDGPYGLAYLRTDSERDIVCIAGGAGLSPAMSLARGVAEEPSMASRRLYFFFGGRSTRDICGEEMLAVLPGSGERIFYHAAISAPTSGDSSSWAGKIGMIHELVSETLDDSDFTKYEFYIAGPPAMIRATVEHLTELHKTPASQIHYDRFF